MHSLEANGIALMSHSSDRLVASILSEPNNIPYALDLLPGHHCKRQVAAGRVASLHRNKRLISSVFLKESAQIRHHTGSSGRWQQRDVHSRVRSRMRRCPPSATSSFQCADALFTFGTAIVLPVYTAMIFAPNRPMTKKVVISPLLYIVLSVLYLYLLSISWTPHHLSLMFASNNWLPELSGITQMFSSPLTVASAWLHLLAVDLYAARHMFLEGLELQIETRHSLVLCLMFGPVGILCHSLTAALNNFKNKHVKESEPLGG